MSEQNKEIQRRELIFKLLDEMKESGERINADKLARKAKMGKQTVLPHYSEWRFLDEADRQNDVELPTELVRVLKRGLIQWRISDSEKQREFEEQANKEIDDLQELVTTLSGDITSLKENQSQLSDENQILKQEALVYQEEIKALRESRVELETNYKAEQAKVESMTEQVTELKKEYQIVLDAQEKKLDSQYQGQINHWMKMLDNERRLRTDVEAKLEQHKNTTLTVEKERNDLQYRLEAKSRAYLDACAERNQYKEKLAKAEPLATVINELALILNVPADELVAKVRHITEEKQRFLTQLEQLPVLSEKVANLEQQLESAKGIEIELEKHKGYREAMEKALEKLSGLARVKNEHDTD